MTRMGLFSTKRQRRALLKQRRGPRKDSGCEFSSTLPSRSGPRCFFRSLLLWSLSSRYSFWKRRKDACSARWPGRNSGRRLLVVAGHHPRPHPHGHFHSRKAAARIGESDLKSYAGSLFARIATLPEIPQDDIVAQFDIPPADVSPDVQTGQSIHSTIV